jgi:hypothetical protein
MWEKKKEREWEEENEREWEEENEREWEKEKEREGKSPRDRKTKSVREWEGESTRERRILLFIFNKKKTLLNVGYCWNKNVCLLFSIMVFTNLTTIVQTFLVYVFLNNKRQLWMPLRPF